MMRIIIVLIVLSRLQPPSDFPLNNSLSVDDIFMFFAVS